VIFALVQLIADLGADAEDRPRRPVPRAEHDLVLPDQLAVVVADLLRAGGPSALVGAVDAVTETAGMI
jgi:hypothetical protein